MIGRITLFYWICGVCTLIYAQEVPHELKFDKLKIKLTAHARREIAEKVALLQRGKRGIAIKVARAQQYFPLIEESLKKEQVPDYFKYLAIQESALISDAVSSSNAVGFWQFKEAAAREVGLRIDRHIDARMNIITSTVGAARYLKRNNFYFHNWMYALTAYYTGRGGANPYVEDKYMGRNYVVISKKNHWYIKTFIAHVLVFEKALAEAPRPKETDLLYAYEEGNGKTLAKIAAKFNVTKEKIQAYNKWLLRGPVPKNSMCPVIVPLKKLPKKKRVKPAVSVVSPVSQSSKHPKSSSVSSARPLASPVIYVNHIPAIVASEGMTWSDLTLQSTVSEHEIRHYNELVENEPIRSGQIYYLSLKRRRAASYYHYVMPEETLWSIAQSYGIKSRSLRKRNRLKKHEQLKTGQLLWLREKKIRAFDDIPDHLNHTTEAISIYTVQSGDTLYSIAKKYNISVRELMQLNQRTDTHLTVGEELRVKR